MFQDEKLPTREQWIDPLPKREVTNTKDHWQHAEKVYEQFQCAILGDYHDL